MKNLILMISSAIKRYFKEMGTPYELRECEPLIEEQIEELRKLLEDSFSEKAAKA